MSETGTVRKWWRDQGFGFVVPDDGSPELFGHGLRKLRAGQRVQFVRAETLRGPRAEGVRPL